MNYQDTLEKIKAVLATWQGTPPDRHELAAVLKVSHVGNFFEELAEIEADGLLITTRKGGIITAEQSGYIIGRLQCNAKGFGFVICPDGEDLYIPASAMRGAIHGDTVAAVISNEKGGRPGQIQGLIQRVLRRAHTRFVGIYDQNAVIPDDNRVMLSIFIGRTDSMGAQSGSKVVAEVTVWSERGGRTEGRIVEVLGEPDEKGVDILSVVREMDLPDHFPKEVLQAADEAAAMPTDSLEGRLDLRGNLIITIDGADAKDLDDAVSVERLENGNFRLGVHIADVSNYVLPGSILDREAYDRGTSVYLLNRVIPMLPEALSNGICSLHPDVDRLTVSCIMEIDPQGQCIKADISESVIRSTHRMTYDDVNEILRGNGELRRKYGDIVELLQQMEELAQILHHMRDERGALELDIPEAYIHLDEQGKADQITIRERGTAHRMIEEFMLSANEAVARWLNDMRLPCMYRVHEDPDPDKMFTLSQFVHNFGFTIKGLKSGKIRPKALQTLLVQAKGRPEENVIQVITLRSLQKARYASQDLGHFGLAAEDYCHFTSPIRRYPDLTVHRAIKAVQQGQITEWINEAEEPMSAWADHCTDREIRAMTAERAVDDLKMAEYMSNHIGERFEGIISGVTDFGIFAQLPNTIEGMIRLTSLSDDYYTFDEKNYCLVGRRQRKIYRLGDPISIIVASVDMVGRRIEFTPVK